MKRILMVAAAFALTSAVAYADNLAGYYGNTVITTAPDGKVTKSKVKADHTYSSVMPDGTAASGTWAWKVEPEACFTQVTPAPAADYKPCCTKIDPHKVGDKWELKDKDGKVVAKYELVAG